MHRTTALALECILEIEALAHPHGHAEKRYKVAVKEKQSDTR